MNAGPDRFPHWKEALMVGFLLAAVFLLLFYIGPTNLSFKKISESDILSIIASLFVVAVFMERTVEAILTPVRSPDRQKIEHAIEDLRQEIENINKIPQSDDSKIRKELHDKQHELDLYQLGSAKRAYWLSYVFGLIISFIGLRALAGLIDPAALRGLEKDQQIWFCFVDVVLTGGVIAGGSAAIDKIGRSVSEFFNLKSATDPKQQS